VLRVFSLNFVNKYFQKILLLLYLYFLDNPRIIKLLRMRGVQIISTCLSYKCWCCKHDRKSGFLKRFLEANNNFTVWNQLYLSKSAVDVLYHYIPILTKICQLGNVQIIGLLLYYNFQSPPPILSHSNTCFCQILNKFLCNSKIPQNPYIALYILNM
jgi:hypothetical protein